MDENEEKKRVEKRKKTPLTREEWLGFFFFPYKNYNETLFSSDKFNREEEERFVKHDFDKKLKQSKDARKLGIAFYVIIILLYNIWFW